MILGEGRMIVTLEEIQKIMRHPDGHQFFNLPPTRDNYHRCVRVDLRYPPANDPIFAFEYQENGRIEGTAYHTLTDIFETLPLMRAHLREQRGDTTVLPNSLMSRILGELREGDNGRASVRALIEALTTL